MCNITLSRECLLQSQAVMNKLSQWWLRKVLAAAGYDNIK